MRISKPKLSLLAELARSGEWQIGFCILEAVITDEGEVTRVKLLQPSSLAPEVERALRAEVQSWRFEPATKDGRPVGVHYKVTLDHCPLRPSAPPAG